MQIPRYGRNRAIDFNVRPDTSFLSTLRFRLLFSKKDHAVFPTEGTDAGTHVDFGSAFTGSDYSFFRVQAWLAR